MPVDSKVTDEIIISGYKSTRNVLTLHHHHVAKKQINIVPMARKLRQSLINNIMSLRDWFSIKVNYIIIKI